MPAPQRPPPTAPVADQRAPRAHPPRRHPRRRLRVAARQGVARGRRPTSRPRTPRPQARTAHLADLRAGDLRRDQGPHPGDRPVGADPRSAATGTTAAPSRASSTARAAACPVARPGRLDPADPAEDARPTSRRCPASRCCSTSTSSPRATSSSRSAASRSARTARCSPTRTDVVGDERYTLRVKDLRHRRACCPTRSPTPSAAPPGTATASTLFYTTVDDAWRPDKVWRHRLGTAAGRRRAGPPRDRRAVLGRRRPHPQRPVPGHRVRLQDHLRVPLPRRRRPDRRVPGLSRRAARALEYSLEHAVIGGEDVFLVLHNARAPNFELGHAPRSTPTPPEDWRPLVPHDPAVRLEDVDAFAGHLVVHQRSDGPHPAAASSSSATTGLGDDYLVEFDEEVYTVGSGGNPEFAQPTVRLGYTTMAVPASVYDYDVAHPRAARCSSADAGARRLRPGRLRAAPAVGDRRGRRRRCRSRSSSPARRRAAGRRRCRSCSTATAPTRPRSTRTSRSPGSRCSTAASAFAIAHVRGGGEMGRQWYDDGKLLHKQNTFTDFVACARHLVDDRLDLRRTGWSPRAAAPAAC